MNEWRQSVAVRNCPHCGRVAIKDDACNYVVCGRTGAGFALSAAGEPMGCGRPWCFQCGGRLCGRMYADNGDLIDSNEDHNHDQDPVARAACSGPGFCPGGHNAHKRLRVAPLLRRR